MLPIFRMESATLRARPWAIVGLLNAWGFDSTRLDSAVVDDAIAVVDDAVIRLNVESTIVRNTCNEIMNHSTGRSTCTIWTTAHVRHRGFFSAQLYERHSLAKYQEKRTQHHDKYM